MNHLRMSPPPRPRQPFKEGLLWLKETLFQLHPFYATCATLVTIYGLSCALSPQQWHILDGANFLFHEAGHAIFRPFGVFLHFLGGTLGQLFFPVLCTVYFYLKHQRFSSFVTMFWLAQNLFNISVYAGDAVATQMPIPENTTHDWNWMLTTLGLLRHTRLISTSIYLVGWICFLCAVGGMFFYSQREKIQQTEEARWRQGDLDK